MTAAIDFDQMDVPEPDIQSISAQYEQFACALSAASNGDSLLEAVRQWDAARRSIDSWHELTHLRFNQDTRNEQYKRRRERCDEIRPQLTELDTRIKRLLLEHPCLDQLVQHFGAQAPALWQADMDVFDTAIQDDLVTEAKLEAEYIELLAGAELAYEGQTYNLSSFGKFREHRDREVRQTTERIRWSWFADNREALDRVFDRLIALRSKMAGKLGFRDFVELGYRRMKRIDYDRHDVEGFRDAVRRCVTPLGVELRKRQAAALGLDALKYHDEAVFDPRGNPAPQGGHDWMLDRAQEMFDAMDSRMGDFFRLMVSRHLLDLKARGGKAGGGFCTSFPQFGVPYIFANFNGTKGDVEVFTHEMGHAFQNYLSQQQPLLDYLWPTYESCEIHSMGLEFLTWPHMEKFFGEDAERFRRIHLEQSLLFLPYGVAVDHFQHLVYARPDATPQERFEMWREIEQTYLPWRDYDGVPHVSDGGMWQLQRHIYLSPFYYIDYTLAQTCALQFWVRSQQDYAQTMDDYVALCRRGGEAPFQQLAQSAGLTSPFQSGCLESVAEQACRILEL
jgi:M3 family oligoendopeptidase